MKILFFFLKKCMRKLEIVHAHIRQQTYFYTLKNNIKSFTKKIIFEFGGTTLCSKNKNERKE